MNGIVACKDISMTKTVNYDVTVTFGDCDPAGIVFFPNFCKWMDASSLNFFLQCGVQPWRELAKSSGIIGTPLLEINTKFFRPATYGDRLQIITSVVEWKAKVFLQRHIIVRDQVVICEGTEVRAFCVQLPGEDGRIASIPVPADIKAMCT